MITGEQGAGKLASPVREETDGKGPGEGHLAGGPLHSCGPREYSGLSPAVILALGDRRQVPTRRASPPFARSAAEEASSPMGADVAGLLVCGPPAHLRLAHLNRSPVAAQPCASPTLRRRTSPTHLLLTLSFTRPSA